MSVGPLPFQTRLERAQDLSLPEAERSRPKGPDDFSIWTFSASWMEREHFAGRQIQPFHLAPGPGFTKYPRAGFASLTAAATNS